MPRFACLPSFLLALVATWTPSALGCTCLEKPPVGAAFAGSDAVFVGRAIGKRDALVESSPGDGHRGYAFRFEVVQSYKGARSAEVTVLTGTGWSDCGWRFRLGGTYLVYANGSQALETTICTRTAPIERAGRDLGELGVPEVIYMVENERSGASALAIALYAALAGLAVGIRWRPKGRTNP